MKIHNLLEQEFKTVRGLVRVIHNPEKIMTEIADMLRSVHGVTIVSNVSHDEFKGVSVYNIKILTLSPVQDAFHRVKQEALKEFPDIKKFEIGLKTLEVLT